MKKNYKVGNVGGNLKNRYILIAIIGIIIIILILFIGIVVRVNTKKQEKIAKEIQEQEQLEKEKEEEVMRFILENKQKEKEEEEKATGVIYLTFDDGPTSDSTPRILEILEKNEVKATFFVLHYSEQNEELIKREHSQGHKVALHGYTHNYSEIYTSADACMENFRKIQEQVYNTIGEKSNIIRFPGGGSNTISRNYARGVVKAIASRMTSDGYVYFDWDVDSGDAAGASRSKIYNNVVNGVKKCSKCVVLMHDIKPNTVNELDNILKTLTSKGYKFGTLSVNSPTMHHSIAN